MQSFISQQQYIHAFISQQQHLHLFVRQQQHMHSFIINNACIHSLANNSICIHLFHHTISAHTSRHYAIATFIHYAFVTTSHALTTGKPCHYGASDNVWRQIDTVIYISSNWVSVFRSDPMKWCLLGNNLARNADRQLDEQDVESGLERDGHIPLLSRDTLIRKMNSFETTCTQNRGKLRGGLFMLDSVALGLYLWPPTAVITHSASGKPWALGNWCCLLPSPSKRRIHQLVSINMIGHLRDTKYTQVQEKDLNELYSWGINDNVYIQILYSSK